MYLNYNILEPFKEVITLPQTLWNEIEHKTDRILRKIDNEQWDIQYQEAYYLFRLDDETFNFKRFWLVLLLVIDSRIEQGLNTKYSKEINYFKDSDEIIKNKKKEQQKIEQEITNLKLLKTFVENVLKPW